MTFVARSVRYVLRKRVRTIVLLIVLTIITASMLSTIAVSRAAQQAAGRIEKEAVGGFVLASNLQGSMLTPRGGGMVRPADVRRSPNCPGSIRIWSVRTPPPISWGRMWRRSPAAMITMRRKNSSSAIRPTS